MSPILRVLPVGLVLSLAGCGSSGVTQLQGSAARGVQVSNVIVKADPAALNAFEQKRLTDRAIDHVLEQAIRTQLATEHKSAAKGPTLMVTIKDFHIRSTGAAVMLGMMAGTDFLDCNVEVTERGKVLKRYSAKSHAVRGYGSEDRVEKMATNLAEDLVEQL
jgi:uncharacterized lipoprotein YmbA